MDEPSACCAASTGTDYLDGYIAPIILVFVLVIKFRDTKVSLFQLFLLHLLVSFHHPGTFLLGCTFSSDTSQDSYLVSLFSLQKVHSLFLFSELIPPGFLLLLLPLSLNHHSSDLKLKPRSFGCVVKDVLPTKVLNKRVCSFLQ